MAIGAVTPCVEIVRGQVRCVQYGGLFQADDGQITFEDTGTENNNFIMPDYEGSEFAQLIGRQMIR